MSVDTKYGEAIFKQTQEVAEMFKAAMPKITTNKNGYEIRTKVLEMAKDNVWSDYHAKFAGWSTVVSKEGDEVVTKVEMPDVPGTKEVLETAEAFYQFVNGKPSNK
jgi:enamine deaminase RidA (YjgF/YER057c/UK114 family)